MPPFDRLPKELRIAIWEATIEPRVISLGCIAFTYHRNIPRSQYPVVGGQINPTVSPVDDVVAPNSRRRTIHLYPYPVEFPVGLAVCSESRDIVGSSYKFCQYSPSEKESVLYLYYITI